MYQPINVTYEAVTSLYRANQILQELNNCPIIAWDLEVATKYTDEDISAIQEEIAVIEKRIQDNLIQDRLRLIELKAKLAATALDHPEHCVVTHCSMAVSENHGYVFIINSKQMLTRLFTFLVTTKVKQVLHNATFDFKYVYYYTQRFPQNYEDTALLAKCILNHVNTNLATVGLKELAGARYGSWAVAPDSFDLSQQYDEKLLLYSATDACATYWLWNSIQRHLESICPPYPSIE